MTQQSRRIVAGMALLCLLCAGFAFGATDSKKVKVNGLITSRDGENLTVRDIKSGGNVIVALDDQTKVQSPKGLGLRHSEQSVTALIPGLKVQVDGVGDDTHVVAKSITFSKEDLQMAETIQAGLNPTQQQQKANMANIEGNKEAIGSNKKAIAANQEDITANKGQIAANQQDIQETTKRFSELSEYDTKATATVLFKSGSSTISDSDKAALTQLAQGAVGTKGYIIQVKGFADSSGNAAMNQKLSMERAQGVVAYLLQNCSVPLRHIVAPGAMGIADPAAPNETPEGRQDNRRVEVKVLVNKGVAGGM